MYNMNQIRRWHDLIYATGVAGNPNVSFYRPERWAPNPGPYQNAFPTGPSDKPMLQPMQQPGRPWQMPTGPSDKPLWQQMPRRPAAGFQRPSAVPYYPIKPNIPRMNRPMVIPPNIPVPSKRYNPWAGAYPMQPMNVIR